MAEMMYILKAILLCHDVRLNTRIETRVLLDHYPTEKEAFKCLWTKGEEVVACNFCADCPFELYGIQIEPEETQPEGE